MRRFAATWVCYIALAAAVAAQMPKYGVKVTTAKNVDFAKFKTYSWTKSHPSGNSTIDAKIVSEVDSALGAVGMSKATSGSGDVQVAYDSLTRTDVNLKAKPGAQDVSPEYTVGTLVVLLLDPANRKELLRMRADKPIESTTQDKLDPVIHSVVQEMFEKYPTRQSKK
jgi:hypothetical protein